MSIITKKIANSEYAYLVRREGKRVVHEYLGPANDPRVIKMIFEKQETSSVPGRFRPLFWDAGLERIQLKRNARYIIERILELGDLDAAQWMQRVYSVQTILDTLALSRNISEKSKNFWLLWFGADDV